MDGRRLLSALGMAQQTVPTDGTYDFHRLARPVLVGKSSESRLEVQLKSAPVLQVSPQESNQVDVAVTYSSRGREYHFSQSFFPGSYGNWIAADFELTQGRQSSTHAAIIDHLRWELALQDQYVKRSRTARQFRRFKKEKELSVHSLGFFRFGDHVEASEERCFIRSGNYYDREGYALEISRFYDDPQDVVRLALVAGVPFNESRFEAKYFFDGDIWIQFTRPPVVTKHPIRTYDAHQLLVDRIHPYSDIGLCMDAVHEATRRIGMNSIIFNNRTGNLDLLPVRTH